MPLKGNVLKQLAKSASMPLRLTAATLTTNVAIHKKMFGSGSAAITILNEEMNDIMKIVKSFEESGLLTKGVSQTIKN